jgi:hypothetical protein
MIDECETNAQTHCLSAITDSFALTGVISQRQLRFVTVQAQSSRKTRDANEEDDREEGSIRL